MVARVVPAYRPIQPTVGFAAEGHFSAIEDGLGIQISEFGRLGKAIEAEQERSHGVQSELERRRAAGEQLNMGQTLISSLMALANFGAAAASGGSVQATVLVAAGLLKLGDEALQQYDGYDRLANRMGVKSEQLRKATTLITLGTSMATLATGGAWEGLKWAGADAMPQVSRLAAGMQGLLAIRQRSVEADGLELQAELSGVRATVTARRMEQDDVERGMEATQEEIEKATERLTHLVRQQQALDNAVLGAVG